MRALLTPLMRVQFLIAWRPATAGWYGDAAFATYGPVDRSQPKEIEMLFSAETLESEIRKLRGLLQMLHEDQPDVMEDVFEFHVTSLITHAAPEHHPRIRSAAHEMLTAIQRQPVRPNPNAPDIRLMPDLLASAA